MRNNKGKFEDRIESAESRVLFVTVKRCCKTFRNFVEELGITRQYCQELMKKEVPIQYASFIARANGFHPGLLNYRLYLLMGGTAGFGQLLGKERFFSQDDKDYILAGRYIENSRSFLRRFDHDFIREHPSKHEKVN